LFVTDEQTDKRYACGQHRQRKYSLTGSFSFMAISIAAGMSVLIWVYLLCARGRFWLVPVRDDHALIAPAAWPVVVAIVPARNEVEVIGTSVGSLLRQNYPGPFSIIVIDDDSNDGTAAAVHAIADDHVGRKVKVVKNQKLPAGWTGKLWAMKQGVQVAESLQPDYLLFTDADIVHAPDSVSWLMAHALSGKFVLASTMAKLRCQSLAERTHVPAFIYFFQMLYPFSWVRQPRSAIAAAAGGCMLVQTKALCAAGGIDSIRNALIDDCALAKRLKAVGPIWLGLTDRSVSIRPYKTFDDVRRMIARSAYAQLGYSVLILMGTILGLTFTFLTAPLLAVFGSGVCALLGSVVWLAMAISFQPTLRFYRLSPLWGLMLPGIALLYACYTLDSAYQHMRRRGGQWKGRVHITTSGFP
jgi:hopene-associated glycosyltransferase HpnB